MNNWTVDTTKMNKKSTGYIVWKLNQLINFGLGKEKLDLRQVKEILGQTNFGSES